uniref:Spt5-NGN domain-containing protein n=1 Tax=Caenorhabditis tropicalis TaxID=1561998 RepID=A0A1I7T5U3_9PELO
MNPPEEVEDLMTAIENNESVRKEKDDPLQRAAQIRIKQKYNCQEEEVTHMRAPFLGFSVFVRFQSRARVHTIKIIKGNDIDNMLMNSPVPYS